MDLIAPYSRELIATVVLLVVVSAGFLARRVLLSRLAAVAACTESVTDDRLVASLRGPLPLWATLAGVYLAMRVLEKRVAVPGFIGTAAGAPQPGH